ncbi:FtsW/RodA/SpoVE family cell cycle protein [Geodermatophilus sabuli]|uniref:Cell division protein FtsI/penicillin-binding protein 2 n=1 Tax=Geodermatophilus sabuli TaxID=1564158 RepID=A0A285EHN7_9ACTN|nr:FtsW/RodA/SpoVE family cell cycle protein [Geodermatophilus sabuli]MBB3084005.1 cell division protein FtsI/penicillin-binding protein 2/cell division protein FtsW (lipid II flippase) [Geodermatophilus sabuli]SNX98652.1 Cell division protein FtsI/penicillin-binding protein 2 [Geodermatophilus sabuli]
MPISGPAGPLTDVRRGRPRTREQRRALRSGAFDLLAVVAALALVGLGLANLYLVGATELAARQAVIALGGVVALAGFWRVRVRYLGVLGWLAYGAAVVLLVGVLTVGLSANGATRWIAIGSLTFQPSELAKLGLILVLAAVLGSGRPPWQRVTLAVLLAVVPIGLTLLQPDLSTTTLLVVLSGAMLVIGRVPARFLLPLVAAAAVAAPLLISLLRPYQVERLGTFLVGAHESPTGSGWALRQAHIAVGSGGLFGRTDDPLRGLRAQYLPERDTDLALASLVGQWGLVAGAGAVLAAIVLVWRLALASRTSRTPHGALVGGGLAVLMGVETVVSVGANLGLLPLAGVPFPLLSYGGTALVVHLAAIGVVLAVRRDGARRRLWVPNRYHPRPRLVRLAALALSVLLISFGLYGWNLQRTQGEALQVVGQEQMTRCIRLPAERGAITDRHGEPLAVNAADVGRGVDRVLVVPALLRTRPADVDRLADLLARPREELHAQIATTEPTTLSLPVAEVPRDVGDAITAAGIAAVLVVPEPRRSYPQGALLGPVLGFAGVATPEDEKRWPDLPRGEFVGRAGLEQQYDAVLRGINGQQCVYVDPTGVPAALGERQAPVPGAELRLSIDLGLQRLLDSGLAAALRAQPRPQGKIGAAVAMDPRTGQVLAMASTPSFDNNVYGPPVDTGALQALADAPGSPMLEHVTQAVAPPGSTFKLVVAAANQAHAAFAPHRAIPTGASFTYGGHTFGNWKPMGPMDLVESIAISNDVYFYKLALALGVDAIAETARSLGVGERTGIDLPAESAGYLGTPESVRERGGAWYGGSTVILGIGQGEIQVTPLQNARWTAAVATGELVTPRLALAVGTDAGTYTALPAPAATPVPFAAELGPVREGMREAVTRGTATRLADLPAPAGAKTGTAQDGGLRDDEYDNWMSAAAPMDAPEIVVTALVQGPGTGGNTARNVVADTLRHYLEHRADVVGTGPVQAP